MSCMAMEVAKEQKFAHAQIQSLNIGRSQGQEWGVIKNYLKPTKGNIIWK